MEHRQPTAAEIARTLLTGVGTAKLESAATQGAVPVLHAETADGMFILVGDAHTLAGLGFASPVDELVYRENLPVRDNTPGCLSARRSPSVHYPIALQISSMAPVLDANIERSSARVAGTICALEPHHIPAALRAECSGVRLGEVLGYRPGVRLFRFGPHGATVQGSAGSQPVSAQELFDAAPDPLAGSEGPALRWLQDEHGDDLLAVVRSLDDDAEALGFTDIAQVQAVQIVGLDQYGLTVQCAWDLTSCIWRATMGDEGFCPAERLTGIAGCHTPTAQLRLSFPAPARTSAEIPAALRALIDARVPAL